MNRIGQAILLVGGAIVAALMLFTLTFFPSRGPSSRVEKKRAADARVAVVYPERTLWREFRQGIQGCVEHGLARVVDDAHDSIVVLTSRHQRRIRFDLHDVRGLRETREEVDRLLHEFPPPLAFVGSSNTVLTAAMATEISESVPASGGERPLLLIPWASSLFAESALPGDGPVALLEINPGWTFRFCPNNQRQADMLVDSVTHLEPTSKPARVLLVEDRQDPFSVDLSAASHRAVTRVAPDTEIVERADSFGSPLPMASNDLATPGPGENALAQSIWADVQKGAADKPTWLFLPLQEDPTLRLITALRNHAPAEAGKAGSLRVICGDGIGLSNLVALAGRCPFPVWCSTASSLAGATRAIDKGLSPDSQVAAEIGLALIESLDRPSDTPLTPALLREGLASLNIGPADAMGFGRSLHFAKFGERKGNDQGHVLMIRPASPEVFAIARTLSGKWDEPRPLKTAALAVRP